MNINLEPSSVEDLNKIKNLKVWFRLLYSYTKMLINSIEQWPTKIYIDDIDQTHNGVRKAELQWDVDGHVLKLEGFSNSFNGSTSFNISITPYGWHWPAMALREISALQQLDIERMCWMFKSLKGTGRVGYNPADFDKNKKYKEDNRL